MKLVRLFLEVAVQTSRLPYGLTLEIGAASLNLKTFVRHAADLQSWLIRAESVGLDAKSVLRTVPSFRESNMSWHSYMEMLNTPVRFVAANESMKPAKPKSIQIHVVTFGEPETGLWCDECLLPSAMRLRLVGQSGMSVMDMGSWTSCPNCETAAEFHERSTRDMRKTIWVPDPQPLDIRELTSGDWTELGFTDEGDMP